MAHPIGGLYRWRPLTQKCSSLASIRSQDAIAAKFRQMQRGTHGLRISRGCQLKPAAVADSTSKLSVGLDAHSCPDDATYKPGTLQAITLKGKEVQAFAAESIKVEMAGKRYKVWTLL